MQTPLGLVGDVTKEDKIIRIVDTAERWFGPLDVIVNAAGINQDGLLVRTKISEIENILNTNLLGAMITTKAALKSMLRQKRGCVINIGMLKYYRLLLLSAQ